MKSFVVGCVANPHVTLPAHVTPHRDARVDMDVETHTYYVDGVSDGMTSCTTLVKDRCFEPFDGEARALSISKGNHMKAEALLADWNRRRDAGSLLHLAIENYLYAFVLGKDENPAAAEDSDLADSLRCTFRAVSRATRVALHYINSQSDRGDDTEIRRTAAQLKELVLSDPCFNQFGRVLYTRLLQDGWRLACSEWMIFDCELRLAGTIDAVFWRPRTGEYMLVDWKRTESWIPKAANVKGRGHGPCADMPDYNISHYTMQLNVYAELLRRQYNIDVGVHMYLAIFRPKLENAWLLQVRVETERARCLLEKYRLVEMASLRKTLLPIAN